MKKTLHKLHVPALLASALLFAGPALSADVYLSGNTFVIANTSGSNVTLSVTGPQGFSFVDNNGIVTRNPGAGGTQGGGLADGAYKYEIKEYTYSGQQTVDDPTNGRVAVVKKTVTSELIRSGTVQVQDGAVVEFPTIEEASE